MNKITKIILIAVFGFMSLPALANADWYYSNSYDLAIANADFVDLKQDENYYAFTSAEACKIKWQSDIDLNYSQNKLTLEFTECFESATTPTKAEFIAKLKPISDFPSSQGYYYFVYRERGSDTAYVSKQYTSDSSCTQGQVPYQNATMGTLLQECDSYAKPPTEIAERFTREAQGADTNQDNQGNFDDDYHLLAPLPGFSVANKALQLGDYLNIIFKIAIGICAALAVVMIVVYSFMYMGEESVFGKTQAKNRIGMALGGLLLALGAYAILNTINPDLVSGTLSIKRIDIELEPGFGVQEGKILTFTNEGGRVVEAKSCGDAKLKTITLFNKSVTVQEDMVPGLERINKEWLAKGGTRFYNVKTIYGYNCRKVAGTNLISAHGYGMALDINPQENPFQNTIKTDMPSEFINLFKKEGWGWGGEWNGKKDPMHFSKFSTERGNIKSN
jgi:hypothetical protein